MTQVTIAEAQQRLPDLLSAVEAGEEVEIRAEDRRTFRLAAGHRRAESRPAERTTRRTR